MTRAGSGRTQHFYYYYYYKHTRTAHGRRELIARRDQDGTGQTNDGREQPVLDGVLHCYSEWPGAAVLCSSWVAACRSAHHLSD